MKMRKGMRRLSGKSKTRSELLRGMPYGRLGVFHYAGIGDWLVFSSLLPEIKNLLPKLKIYVVGGRNIEWLLKKDPYIEGYSINPDWSALRKNFSLDEKIFVSTLIGFLKASNCRLHILGLTRKVLGIPLVKNSFRPRCYLSEEDEVLGKKLALGLKGRMIALCNDTSQREKNWDPERWGRIVEIFKDHIFVQIGSSSSPPIPGTLCMAGKITIEQAMGIVKHARLFAGVDGVYNHASRALGVPQVILWGPYDPVNFAYGEISVNIWNGSHCGNCVEISNRLCMNKTPKHLSPCLDAIKVPVVENAIRKILEMPYDTTVDYYKNRSLHYSCGKCSFRKFCSLDFFAKPLSDLFLWKIANPAER